MEAYTFRSDITTIKILVEIVEPLRYKLQIFRILIYGQTSIFWYNIFVYTNTTQPESTLINNHHSIHYRHRREEKIVSNENTSTNLSDVFTNTMVRTRTEDHLSRFAYQDMNLEYVGFLPQGKLPQAVWPNFIWYEPNLDVTWQLYNLI